MWNKIKNWLNSRYNNDGLNMLLMGIMIICAVITSFVDGFAAKGVMVFLTLAFAFLVLFRSFSSKDNENRIAENREFMKHINRMKQKRTHCFFKCPKCKRVCRVPRHVGKVRLTCPSCGESFVRNTGKKK